MGTRQSSDVIKSSSTDDCERRTRAALVVGTRMSSDVINSSSTDDCEIKVSKRTHQHLLVASIDIGNTITRCAFSFLLDPTKVNSLCYLSSSKLVDDKFPTAVLLDNNEQFDSLGFDAIEHYEENKKGHFFLDIKQPLYKMTDGQVIYIKDEQGTKTEGLTVIREIIKQIKNELFAVLNNTHTRILPEEVYWVVTVPAVFTEQTLDLVRRAVKEGGISENNINIALEPVAALEYCQHIYHHRQGHDDSVTDIFTGGKQFMVVDIGGKTLDVTILEKNSSGDITELHKVCGIGYGGNRLHESFDDVLKSVVGVEVFEKFKTEEKNNDYRTLHSDLDKKLDYNKLDTMTNIRLRIPDSLNEYDCFSRSLETSAYAGDISSTYCGIVKISTAFLKKQISDYCHNILDILSGALGACRNIIVLIVGGYAKVLPIQEVINHTFPDVEIFVPSQPGISTVFGAVLLGHKPHTHVERAQITSNTIKNIENETGGDYIEDDLSRASDFIHSINRTSDFLKGTVPDTTSKPFAGMVAMKRRCKGEPQKIMLRRNDIINDVVKAYGDIDVSRPLEVRFVGEEDRNVSEEMFGIFWERIASIWFTGENAIFPYVPVKDRTEARRLFPVLGKVVEHMLNILGYFPPQLSRSTVLTIAGKEVSTELILEDYLSFVPDRESKLLTVGLKETQWSEDTKKRLERFFNAKKASCNLKPESFESNLLNIAYAEIIDPSHVYITLIRESMSDFVKELFDSLSPESLLAYRVRDATSESVAQLVENLLDESDYSAEEEVIITYVIDFISRMTRKQLRQFLIWLTGSPNMPDKIKIAFRSSCAGPKTPTAYRDRKILELSKEFNSYREFGCCLTDAVFVKFFKSAVSNLY